MPHIHTILSPTWSKGCYLFTPTSTSNLSFPGDEKRSSSLNVEFLPGRAASTGSGRDVDVVQITSRAGIFGLDMSLTFSHLFSTLLKTATEETTKILGLVRSRIHFRLVINEAIVLLFATQPRHSYVAFRKTDTSKMLFSSIKQKSIRLLVEGSCRIDRSPHVKDLSFSVLLVRGSSTA